MSHDVKSITPPVINEWFEISGVYKSVHASGTLSVNLRNYHASVMPATNEKMHIKYAIAIDLSSAFGQGAEPSATQVDRLLNASEYRWFANKLKLGDVHKLLIKNLSNELTINDSDTGKVLSIIGLEQDGDYLTIKYEEAL